MRTVAPVPPVYRIVSAGIGGRDVDAKTLMAGPSSLNGGVPMKAVTNDAHAVLKAFCCAAVKPSPSSTTLKARLRGALP